MHSMGSSNKGVMVIMIIFVLLFTSSLFGSAASHSPSLDRVAPPKPGFACWNIIGNYGFARKLSPLPPRPPFAVLDRQLTSLCNLQQSSLQRGFSEISVQNGPICTLKNAPTKNFCPTTSVWTKRQRPVPCEGHRSNLNFTSCQRSQALVQVLQQLLIYLCIALQLISMHGS
ncbi:hypothetical protein DsansV1_C35g0229421 [Dioscorea sansibarensis]